MNLKEEIRANENKKLNMNLKVEKIKKINTCIDFSDWAII